MKPDPTPVLNLLDAFRQSKAMFAAVSLGVFDRLASGPASAAVLAEDLHAHPDGLARLLNACVAAGLLSREGDAYTNTPAAAAYLCTQSPLRLTGYVRYSDVALWRMWAHLADAVREGTNRWRQAFGLEGPLFDNYFRTEADKREFLLGLHGLGQMSSPQVVAAFDLGRFRHLVDLGGATGHLSVAACRRYPALQAVVFDLPAVLPLARELVSATEVADRVHFLAGDFFTDPLPEADLFVLGRIVHDWSETKVHRLLRAVYERLPPGGALLLAEKLLDDDLCGPSQPVFQSLNMLVCTEGKERSLAQYRTLLADVGFRSVEGRRTDAPLDAVLAIKE